MTDSFYSSNELKQIGFKFIGNNVQISKKCSIYGAQQMIIGNHVRIDDFCILSGKIEIANYVHISAYSALYGKAGIRIGNFCGISPRSTIFSASDDFSGEFMISPLVPQQLTNVISKPVVLNDFVQLGTQTTVMPGVIFAEGSVTGANSLVLKNTEEWSINIGIPCKFHKKRKTNIKQLSLLIGSLE